MNKILLLSPVSGKDLADIGVNLAYAQRALANSILQHDEVPIATHLMYGFVLQESDDFDRCKRLELEHALVETVDYVVIYTDKGISPEMVQTANYASSMGLQIIRRQFRDA
jgi:hypothetical protein